MSYNAMFCWETSGPSVHLAVTLTQTTHQTRHQADPPPTPAGCSLTQQDKVLRKEQLEEHDKEPKALTRPPNSLDPNPIKHEGMPWKKPDPWNHRIHSQCPFLDGSGLLWQHEGGPTRFYAVGFNVVADWCK